MNNHQLAQSHKALLNIILGVTVWIVALVMMTTLFHALFGLIRVPETLNELASAASAFYLATIIVLLAYGFTRTNKQGKPFKDEDEDDGWGNIRVWPCKIPPSGGGGPAPQPLRELSEKTLCIGGEQRTFIRAPRTTRQSPQKVPVHH
jgi:hypothetical protein